MEASPRAEVLCCETFYCNVHGMLYPCNGMPNWIFPILRRASGLRLTFATNWIAWKSPKFASFELGQISAFRLDVTLTPFLRRLLREFWVCRLGMCLNSINDFAFLRKSSKNCMCICIGCTQAWQNWSRVSRRGSQLKTHEKKTLKKEHKPRNFPWSFWGLFL